MFALLRAMLLCGVVVFPALAQESRTFPGLDDLLAAGGDEKVVTVDPKVLRKKLGAKDIKWDSKSGVLSLAYDFNKGQDKDWEIQDDCISRPSNVRGIRLGAATKIVHKVMFAEGSCSFQFAISQIDDKGPLLSAGDVIVRQHMFNDRSFFLNNKEANLGNDSDKVRVFAVSLLCQEKRCSLKVNRSEVAFGRDSGQPFQFVLHGGENGGEFGSLTIAGKPEKNWLAEIMK